MNLKYDCWGYKNGKPAWNISVIANNKTEAEAKAWQKFRDLGRNPERVTVK